jgi:hypothetical protein
VQITPFAGDDGGKYVRSFSTPRNWLTANLIHFRLSPFFVFAWFVSYKVIVFIYRGTSKYCMAYAYGAETDGSNCELRIGRREKKRASDKTGDTNTLAGVNVNAVLRPLTKAY